MDYKAFVSSTYIDLKDHRAHVIRELRKAGFFVDPMEDWTSSANEPKEFSRERLEGCHLCVLFIARRRGHVPRGEQLSITQMEFEEAQRRKIDILHFLLDDSIDSEEWPWEEEDIVKRWRAEVFEHFGVETFKKTPSTLKIGPALTRWVQEKGPQVALRLYLESVKQHHGYIKFLGLPRLEDIKDAPIQRLYVEPAVADRRWVSPALDPKDWPETRHVLDALAFSPRAVLLGDPGSGKSTLVDWLAWQLSEHHDDGTSMWTERIGRLIPLPMILRELRIGAEITWDKLLEAFVSQPLGKLLTLANLQRILADGRAMIMLDGLDEIGNPAARRDLRDAVQQAMQSEMRCHWLLTSRIVGYDEVNFHVMRPSGGPLQFRVADPYYIAPFDDKRVHQFAHNWFALREQTEHKAKQGAKGLLEAIRSDEATKKLGRIPNLLTMMALIYRVRARLPHGRALLYNEIAQAYLETIDFFRRIATRTEPLADKKRWVARVGFEMQRIRSVVQREIKPPVEHDETLEIFATGDEVRRWLAAAMSESGGEASDEDAAEFVDYLGRRAGLLLPRGEDQFAFLHLSFQEYFAACFLQNQIASPDWLLDDEGIPEGVNKEDLRGYAGQSVWRETLVFLIELLAASDQPKWLRPAREALFGKDYAGVAEGDESAQGQAALLARLAVDPHAGFTDDDRRRAVDACCRWEARAQNIHIKEVLWVLLGVESEADRRTALDLFVAAAEQVDLRRLRLDGTSVSDLTPLSELRSLQTLNLSGTSVSDLTPLSRLGGLQELYLVETPVSDLMPLAGLAQLGLLVAPSVPDEQVKAFHEARKRAGLPEVHHLGL